MELGALRDLTLTLNLAAHGVPATVTWPPPDDDTPITTSGIWLTPIEETRAYGLDFQRREPRKILALPRNEVSKLPRGTLIVAPERQGQATKTWRVDGLVEPSESDLFRAFVVPVASDTL